jgi:hypothetical protein
LFVATKLGDIFYSHKFFLKKMFLSVKKPRGDIIIYLYRRGKSAHVHSPSAQRPDQNL